METKKLLLIIAAIIVIVGVVAIVYNPDAISQLTGSAQKHREEANRQENERRNNDQLSPKANCTPDWQCKEYDGRCRGRNARSETKTFQSSEVRKLPGPAVQFTAQSEYLASISTTQQADNVNYLLVDKKGKVVLRTSGNALRTQQTDAGLKTGEEYRLYPATKEDRAVLGRLCADPANCKYTIDYNKRASPAQVNCKELQDKNRCDQPAPTDLTQYAKQCSVCVANWTCATFSTTCTATPGTTTFDIDAQMGTIYDTPGSLWGAATAVSPTNSIKTVAIGYADNGGAFQALPAQYDTMTWQWIWYYDTLLGAGEEAAETTGSTASDVPMPQGKWYIVRAFGDAASVANLTAFCGTAGRVCQFKTAFDTTKYTAYSECTAVKDLSNCGVVYNGTTSDFSTTGSCSG